MKIFTGSAVDVSSLTEIRLRIWRFNGSTFDLVGESENFATDYKTGYTPQSIYTRTLSTKIQGAQFGDFVGLRIDGAASISNFISTATGVAASGKSYSALGATTTAVDFNIQLDLNAIPCIQCLSTPPWGVYVSGSYGVGQNNASAYDGFWTDAVDTIDRNRMISYLLGQTIAKDIQNNSEGGNALVSKMVANFDDRIGNLSPKVIFLIYGSNDAAASTSLASFQANSEILWANAANVGRIVTATIPPRTDLTEAQHDLRLGYNTILRTLAKQYNALIVDFNVLDLGKRRTTIDRYNKWDISTTYDSGDNIHYTLAGYQIMENALLQGLQNDHNRV